MELSAGARIGPYEVVGLVGAGGMGEVYRARDERLGREVAIKILPRAVRGDPERLRRFVAEARAAGALDHPNVLSVHAFEVDGETPYLVAELLDGRTLREELQAGPLGARRAIDLAAQIAQGLAAAHDRGIVHRDLKPENLFVTRDGRVKILDFGLAKALLDEPSDPAPPRPGGDAPDLELRTATGAVFGTAGYMSPEQVQGRPVDARSDLFSLGAILYEMLAGQRAFPGATPVEKSYAILRQAPAELPPSVSALLPGIEAILSRCLAKDPAARFQSARDLGFALELGAGGRGSLGGASATARLGLGPAVAALRAPGAMARGVALALGGCAIAALAALAGRWSAPPPAGAPAAGGPRYERLTYRREYVGAARFAPDGRTIVYTATAEGGPQVFMTTAGNPEGRPLTGPGATLAAVSSTGEMALLLRPRSGPHKRGGKLARAPLGGGAPRELLDDVVIADWSPDGAELMAVRSDGGRLRIEYPIGTLLVEADGWVGAARIAPDGQSVAFVHHLIDGDDRGSIELVDRARVRRTLSGGWASVDGLAWSPDGREVWFAGAHSGTARGLRAASLAGRQRTIAEVPGPLTLWDLARDGRALVTRDFYHGEMVAHVAGQANDRDLSWFDFSMPIDLSADGSRVLFMEGAGVAKTELIAFFRDLDGSPAVRLGEGEAMALSPDGRLALLSPRAPYTELMVVPTGAGVPRTLPPGPIASYARALFLSDGQRAVIEGREPGRPWRLWVQDLAGGEPRPLGPEGLHLVGNRATFDDARVLAHDDSRRFFTVAIGPLPPRESARQPAQDALPVEIRRLPPGHEPIQFGPDGRALIVTERERRSPRDLYRFDPETGAEEPFRSLRGLSTSGLTDVACGVATPDWRTWVFGAHQLISELYLVEGLGLG